MLIWERGGREREGEGEIERRGGGEGGRKKIWEFRGFEYIYSWDLN